jgi:hypothetical protein
MLREARAPCRIGENVRWLPLVVLLVTDHEGATFDYARIC